MVGTSYDIEIKIYSFHTHIRIRVTLIRLRYWLKKCLITSLEVLSSIKTYVVIHITKSVICHLPQGNL